MNKKQRDAEIAEIERHFEMSAQLMLDFIEHRERLIEANKNEIKYLKHEIKEHERLIYAFQTQRAHLPRFQRYTIADLDKRAAQNG